MQDITASNQHALELAQRGLTPVQYTTELSRLVATGEIGEARFKELCRAYNTQYEVEHRRATVSSAAASIPAQAPGQPRDHDSKAVGVFIMAAAVFAAFYYFEPHFHAFVNETWHSLRHEVREQVQ